MEFVVPTLRPAGALRASATDRRFSTLGTVGAFAGLVWMAAVGLRRGIAARFAGESSVAKFDELAANSGVDTLKEHDAWVIVPEGGANQVFLREGVGYAHKVKSDGGLVQLKDVPPPPHSRDPRNMVASASRGKNDRLLKFTSQKKGMGRVLMTKGNYAVSIGFSVHPKKTHTISFFFLQDQVGTGVKYRTKFSKSNAADWVKDLNGVYGPQANIWFEVGKADPLPLVGLSQVISVADAPALERKKDGALINIFLAGTQIKGNESDFPNGFFAIKEKLIVVKDQDPTGRNSKPMLKTMAHEVAHLLNYHRSAATAGHQYYEKCGYLSDVLNTLDGADIKIPHQRVLDWNPW